MLKTIKKFLRSKFYVLSADRGFTLIEVLIVVAITSLLSGMVMTYSSRGRTQVALYVEAAKLSQVILRAKSLAVATYSDPNLLGSGIPCGYGVQIDYAAGTYSLFSYMPALPSVSCRPTPVGALSGIGANPVGEDPTNYIYSAIDTVRLSPGVVYGSGNPKLTDILFIPPDPATLIWSDDSAAASNVASEVDFVSTADALSKVTVKISAAGQITF